MSISLIGRQTTRSGRYAPEVGYLGVEKRRASAKQSRTEIRIAAYRIMQELSHLCIGSGCEARRHYLRIT
jgi:hypothetical protein